ncbi:hypothetical protein NP493_558g01003 [Ridgeia piscesae]|uniref:Uncharacterized protein n=1 Tax=Ridgeia piscesae TaxID=27915 RepID=A0AAD9NPL9_RIDPI|nr:hypothetical protein NP493_558g01003 [Ridgeia piscesae]
MAEQTGVLELLCSSAKIKRDRGAIELHNHLRETDSEGLKQLENSVRLLLQDADAPWERKHGALMGFKELLGLGVTDENLLKCSDEFTGVAKECALHMLEDSESRVRLAAGEVMGMLCRRVGPSIYEDTKDVIMQGVITNLERQPMIEPSASGHVDTEKLAEKLTGSTSGSDADGSISPGTSPRRVTMLQRLSSTSAEEIFHDTAGWKSLETWMKCLQAVINGCGTNFNRFVTQELLDLIFQTLSHTNRFVRETGYYVCGSLVGCNYSESGEVLLPPEENAIYQLGDQFSKWLGTGLADNWSQVRLAASVATRQFLLGLSEGDRFKFYNDLLPPLCLNRYYVAEGVRIYNQETWRQVTAGGGRRLVEQHIQPVVDFYVKQTEADNHAVREAACACIAELGSKVDKDVVRAHVPKLLDALLVCFKDESWPVRDASCVACGNFVLCFPEESKGAMTDLYTLFFENLQDAIASVRQGAALALANVVRAYGKEAQEIVLGKAREGLAGVEKQEVTAERYSSLDKSPATYGVVKRLRDNDMELHTDKQMYSCGSLAPKMHRGKRGGGCMDHQFKRPSEPWELGDGCIYLLAELSQLPDAAADVAKELPLVATTASFQHYTQHVHLLETMCKQLPVIAKGIGKRAFKMHIELFFDAIFYSLSCDNALTSTAAGQCLEQLSAFLGPNIMRGRVEQYNPRYVEQLDRSLTMPPMGPSMRPNAGPSRGGPPM